MSLLVRSTLACRLYAATAIQKNSTRGFLTPPNLSSFLPGASEGPQTYHERKIFPYKPSQLYGVVKDVENYPRFLPYCAAARILSRSPPAGPSSAVKMEAELTVRFMAFEAAYTSLVTCVPNQSVEAVAASSSPIFKSLTTIWRFQPASSRSPHPSNAAPLTTAPSSSAKPPGSGESTAQTPSVDDGPTLVSLDLSFIFANAAYAGASQMFFGQVSRMMVSAFEERCIELYGPGKR